MHRLFGKGGNPDERTTEPEASPTTTPPNTHGPLETDGYRFLIETIPVMTWTADASGYLDYISPQFYEFTGAQREDDEDGPTPLHPDDRQSVVDAWNRCVAQCVPYEIDFRLRSRDGLYRWFSAKASPLERNGEVRWYGSTVDIDVQKRDELNQRRSTGEKDRFITMLGHELRNPMAAIATSHEILRKWKPEDSRLEEAVSVLGGQIQHLRRLVDDTLDISRLETGRLNLKKQTVVIDELIEECTESFRETARKAEITLSCETSTEGATVNADPSRLAQCVANLISNSLKFTPRGGAVDLHTKLVGEDVEITVKDSGAGFSDRELKGFFKPFQQGSATARTLKDGMGLGLSVVKRLIELHGGSASATSDGIDRGASFSLRLPVTGVREIPHEVAEGATGESPEPHVSDADILIIEDNESVARALTLLFELDGHRVRHAPDADSAFDLLDERSPDLVFCDLSLPGSMNGWEIAARLTDQMPKPHTPLLVALSGHAMKHYVERSLAAGFDHHVPKPPEPEQLRRLVADAVARRG